MLAESFFPPEEQGQPPACWTRGRPHLPLRPVALQLLNFSPQNIHFENPALTEKRQLALALFLSLNCENTPGKRIAAETKPSLKTAEYNYHNG